MSDNQISELSAVQVEKLRICGELRRFEADWRSRRLMTIGCAAELVDCGALQLEEACAALEISVSTWYRRRAELRAYLAGQGGDAARAAGDQAAAGVPGLPADDDMSAVVVVGKGEWR